MNETAIDRGTTHMTAQPAFANSDPAVETSLSDPSLGDRCLGDRCIAELITHALCGLHRLNDHFVRINATLGDDGYVAVEVTRVSFNGEDATMRVLLHPTEPVPVPPPLLAGIGPGPGAA